MSVPLRHSYVIVWIDPEETLEHLDDEEVREACRRLNCGKYVAVVTSGIGLPIPGMRYHSYSIDFVIQGFPSDNPDTNFESAMSCPILPNTFHPEGRRPLRAIQPLPWPDCHHRALCNDDVKFRLRYSNARPQSYLNATELLVLQQCLSEDYSRMTVLERCKESGTEPPPRKAGEITNLMRLTIEAADNEYTDRPDWEEIPLNSEFDEEENAPMQLEEPHSQPNNQGDGQSYSSSGSYTDEEGNDEDGQEEDDDDDDDFGLAILTAMLGHQEDGGMLRMVMNVSYDLSLVDSPPDPAGYFKEVEAIIQIEEDFKQRMLRNIEQVKRQDEEYITSLQTAQHAAKAPTDEHNTKAPIDEKAETAAEAAPEGARDVVQAVAASTEDAEPSSTEDEAPPLVHAGADDGASLEKPTSVEVMMPQTRPRKKRSGFLKVVDAVLKRMFCWPRRTEARSQ
ncbi:hypothetical protein BD626DRAFT_449245 [Schizophyllum amplum]|uniref:Uncharacterized protein n=1 Tax=Schizophyllum amplum TaxID=97359 RepID=A0A550D0S6_9AGAR|nr:hypothetical protein BD626DRAFT_449245 [Auriculariopsis ampla]